MSARRRVQVKFPLALARISAAVAEMLPIEKRIGRFVGRASTPEAFVVFGREVLERARESLTTPLRLLTLPHLKNAIASRVDGLEDATRDLVEGYVFQLVREGCLFRLQTVSRGMKPYQVLYWHGDWPIVNVAEELLIKHLKAEGYLSLTRCKRLLPAEIGAKEQHVELFFGHLLYLGVASTDCAPDTPISNVRLPYAPPRL